jgi:hypothetical protein
MAHVRRIVGPPAGRAPCTARPATGGGNPRDRFALLLPDPRPRITVEIDFPNPVIGRQRYSMELDAGAFVREIAPARTFGFARDLHALRARGLAAGGSLRSAILVDEQRVVNEEGLRFPDEFVRHKLLDCVGDLALLGTPVIGLGPRRTLAATSCCARWMRRPMPSASSFPASTGRSPQRRRASRSCRPGTPPGPHPGMEASHDDPIRFRSGATGSPVHRGALGRMAWRAPAAPR